MVERNGGTGGRAKQRQCFMQSVAVVSWLVLAVGCNTAADTSPLTDVAGHHPRASFLRETAAAPAEWRLAQRAGALPVAPHATPGITIGVAEGDERRVFGDISDVGLFADGRVAVLDALAHDLRLFSADGAFLQRLGGGGAGPGELGSPRALAIAPDGDLLVADMQRRITRYARGADGYEFADVAQTELSLRGLCFLGDALIAHALSLSDSFALRRLGPDGRVERSFATLYASPNRMVNLMLSEGKVACDEEAGLVYFAPEGVIGEVRAYRKDGTLAWRSVARDFRGNRLVDTEDGGYTLELAPDGVHVLHTLEVVPGHGVLVQYSYRTHEELRAREPPRADVTALLARGDGAAVVADRRWPLIGALRGDVAAAVAELPYPHLSLRRLTTGTGF